MKKISILFAIFCAGFLASCGNNGAEVARLKAQVDSLVVVTERLEAENFEMSEAIENLAAAIDEIRAKKVSQAASASSSSASASSTPKQSASSSSSSSSKQEAKSSGKEQSQPKASASTSSSSPSGYYMKIGTKQELKSAGLLDKGVIKKGVVNTDGLNMSIFKSVNIKNTKELKINAYKPKLLTDHPAKSYEMKLDEDSEEDITYLRIKDPDAFWSKSHFLIIQM